MSLAVPQSSGRPLNKGSRCLMCTQQHPFGTTVRASDALPPVGGSLECSDVMTRNTSSQACPAPHPHNHHKTAVNHMLSAPTTPLQPPYPVGLGRGGGGTSHYFKSSRKHRLLEVSRGVGVGTGVY